MFWENSDAKNYEVVLRKKRSTSVSSFIYMIKSAKQTFRWEHCRNKLMNLVYTLFNEGFIVESHVLNYDKNILLIIMSRFY